MTKSNMRRLFQFLCRFGFGCLTAVLLCLGILFYAVVIATVLPSVLYLLTEHYLTVIASDMDVWLCVGSVTIVIAVLVAFVSWRLLCLFWNLMTGAYRNWVQRWGLCKNGDGVNSSDTVTQQPVSFRSKVVAFVVLVCALSFLIFVIYQNVTEDDAGQDSTTSALSEDMLTYEGPYPTLDEKDLTLSANDLNMSEWTESDASITDDMSNAVSLVTNAKNFENKVKVGFTYSGNADEVADLLVTCAEKDTADGEISKLMPDDVTHSGVFYDMSFTMKDDVWRQFDSVAGLTGAAYMDGVEMIYADNKLYVSTAPSEPGVETDVKYTATEVDMDGYNATVVYSLLNGLLTNEAAADGLKAYTKETDDGMDYYYVSSGEQSFFSEAQGRSLSVSIQKQVLFETVDTGLYDAHVVYTIVGGEGSDAFSGTIAFSVESNLVPDAVNVPDASVVQFES